ncbi:TPA: N-acetyltransferase family protein [Klebsiella variicola]|uniref:GNAT family N-acetyltransferase n=1 Tax=Klebsiella variicola TaxID=244366 RepID=UPI001259BAA2|nr:GNAT family N-acetyltransferase [Klebsiella variicola]HCB0430816.1 GNAT family N-acetyltransferase [Klebsiella variicola subsp. variicola]VAU24011.1 GNAT family acetyltransferase [Klebsiella variicola]HBS5838759.1 GNAT family N-acetyltransferase [Klebsiella variicola]HCB0435712.1 GNAT family N-acetyltransferase [Klebsiella variicola subsp. variicola]HCC2858952.1 GNAT family N-acetyltransferase [Klebsiella variicola]
MTTSFSLRTLSRDDILHHLPALSDILASCVNGGASVSFMLPFSAQTATTFWQHTADSVAAGERIVLAALDADERPVGTVQLITRQPENQPHRADVAKLLVHQNARRQGIANALMSELEHVARQEGKTVLVLDTAAGSGAEQFYVRCGWEKVGEIPRYALMPDGEMTATSLFYKFLP